MADEKKILVVDDHFEMLEFLRSMLELSNQDFEVLAVPSAEEGLMELRRVHFDLVITDVRLPGMSGFDLVRRTRSIKSDIPVIMITAYSSAQGQKEAADLGVLRYFSKPLDTDEMLSAVHQALYGETVTAPRHTAVSQPPATSSPPALPNRLRKRLDSLRNDTGAAQLILATVAGDVALKVGNGRIANPNAIIKILAQTIADSFDLARELDSQEPFTLQFHAGSQTELYAATVGHDYFLAMFFDVQARRGRIGTVWVFAQRAIKELLELLPSQDQAAQTKPVVEPVVVKTAVTPPPQPIHAPPMKPEPEPEMESDDWLDIEPEELADLLASETELLNDTGDLNAFWDDALTETDISGSGSGLSFEEARRRGLFPSDLDLDDSQES
jgi:DNA-binding response OmpR family regulator